MLRTGEAGVPPWLILFLMWLVLGIITWSATGQSRPSITENQREEILIAESL